MGQERVKYARDCADAIGKPSGFNFSSQRAKRLANIIQACTYTPPFEVCVFIHIGA